MKLNNILPCNPKIFQVPILSEQDKLRVRLSFGKSSLPGLVLKQCRENFYWGTWSESVAKYFKGLAPEKRFEDSFTIQSPQNISLVYIMISYYSLILCFNLSFFQTNNQLSLPSWGIFAIKYFINPLLARISACISLITFPLCSFAIDSGKDLVPNPNDTIFAFYYPFLYIEIEEITVSFNYGSFLNFCW